VVHILSGIRTALKLSVFFPRVSQGKCLQLGHGELLPVRDELPVNHSTVARVSGSIALKCGSGRGSHHMTLPPPVATVVAMALLFASSTRPEGQQWYGTAPWPRL
jgi:hypothetical protein